MNKIKVTNSVWNKDELPQQWKEPIILPIYNGVLKLSVAALDLIIMIYHQLQKKKRSLCNIRRSRLIPYSEEIIVDCQSGFISSAESANILGQNKNATNKREKLSLTQMEKKTN
jgi:hypothetical protein